MKYDSELDHYQNLRAWRRHSRSAPQTEFDSLNEREKQWLQNLNELLSQLEKKFYPIMAAKDRELRARVDDPSDWMQDFNLDRVITFYLREDDPEYEEDDDNILLQIEDIFIENDDLDMDFSESVTFSGEKHCYLYHQLYDHFGLDWRDLLRIGSLYVDIKIEEQSGSLPVSPIGEVIET